MSSPTEGRADERSVRERLAAVYWPGVLASGAGAFLLGYLVMVLVVVGGPGSTSGDAVGVLVLLGFVFYSAQTVPLDIGALGRIDILQNQAADGGTALPLVVYYAVPVLVLVGVSFLATYRFTDREPDPVQTVATVGGFAVVYAIVMIAGTVVFRSSSIFGGPAKLVLPRAALFGFVYPLVFGTLGAAIAALVKFVKTRNKEGTAGV